jgi:predicted ABC-type ATPase
MSSKPKLRIFAGPNGSGKTTLYDSIKAIYFSTRLFINADQLEEYFKKFNFINLSEYDVNISDLTFQKFCSSSGLFQKAGFSIQIFNLSVRENIIVKTDSDLPTLYNSYHFAILADFIRHELISTNKSFSFETVFSHPSKLNLISLAQLNGYKVYLYFIGTETPLMNLERVKDRVMKGGHPVESEKIEKRYFLTMDLLIDMIKNVDETYLWDNSGIEHKFLGNIKNGFLELQQSIIPAWIDKFILNKFKV